MASGFFPRLSTTVASKPPRLIVSSAVSIILCTSIGLDGGVSAPKQEGLPRDYVHAEHTLSASANVGK